MSLWVHKDIPRTTHFAYLIKYRSLFFNIIKSLYYYENTKKKKNICLEHLQKKNFFFSNKRTVCKRISQNYKQFCNIRQIYSLQFIYFNSNNQ